jgi:hypothetical protein
MAAADLRERDDATTRSRWYFARIEAVVVQASEVPFVDHDDVIEAFPSNRPLTRSATGFCTSP